MKVLAITEQVPLGTTMRSLMVKEKEEEEEVVVVVVVKEQV